MRGWSTYVYSPCSSFFGLPPRAQVDSLFEAINISKSGHMSQVEFSRFLGLLSNYDQTDCFGITMLFDTAGSVYSRVWMFGVIAALVCLLSETLVYYCDAELLKKPIKNNYIFQITSVLIGITIVFRTNLSYRRFWEGNLLCVPTCLRAYVRVFVCVCVYS